MSLENPFAAPSSGQLIASEPHDYRWSTEDDSPYYGGIGRRSYFCWHLGISILGRMLLQTTLAYQSLGYFILLMIISTIASIVLVLHRIKNLGYRDLWVLGIFVPILNVVITGRCLACPGGYADHRTLDTPGKIIAAIYWTVISLSVIFIVALATA